MLNEIESARGNGSVKVNSVMNNKTYSLVYGMFLKHFTKQ